MEFSCKDCDLSADDEVKILLKESTYFLLTEKKWWTT